MLAYKTTRSIEVHLVEGLKGHTYTYDLQQQKRQNITKIIVQYDYYL